MAKYFAIPLLTQIFIKYSGISNRHCTCVHFIAYTVTQLLFLYHGQIQFGQYFPNTLYNNLNKVILFNDELTFVTYARTDTVVRKGRFASKEKLSFIINNTQV